MALALVAGGVVIVHLARYWNLFFYDEWGTIFYRRAGGFESFFAPHNGHLQAVVIGIYRLLFSVVGLRHFGPYRGVILASHLIAVALLFLYLLRRRVQPEVAIGLSLLVLGLGRAWEVVLWPINVGFVVPVIALIVVLLIWDREGFVWTTFRVAALSLALASSSLGVVVVIALAVETAMARDRWGRWWEVAAPATLYAGWYLLYRPSAMTPAALRVIAGAYPQGDIGGSGQASTLHQAPGYLARLAEAATNGLFGIDPAAGPWCLLGCLFALALGARRRDLARRRIVGLGIALCAFWLFTMLARGGLNQPFSSRYVYPAAVLIVLMAAELLAGVVVPRGLLAVGLAVTAVSVVLGLAELSRMGNWARSTFTLERSELRALASSSPPRPVDYQPDPYGMPGVARGPYLAAVRALGFPPGAAVRLTSADLHRAHGGAP